MPFKKYFLFLILNLVMQSVWGQAKKPTLMVVPSDIYCIEKGFFQETTVHGLTRKDPDYRRAFQEDADLRAIISNINNYMVDQDFPLKDMEAELKQLEIEDIEEEAITDKAGNELKESRLDKIKRRSKADIVLDIYFSIKRNGPEKIMTFNLKGLDAYTSKQITGVENAGKPSANTNVEIMLREDIYPRMTDFNNRLQMHFDRMFKEGREARIVIRLSEGVPVDFETEYGDKELSEVIDHWFQVNSVSGRYTIGDMSDVRMTIVARLPLFDQNNKAIDTREFAQQLRRFLQAAPYNLSGRVVPRGLGEAYLIIGAKK